MTTRYEYKVVPAPNRGIKRKGLKDPDARFAAAVTEAMNELGAEGWEYLRTDSLPCEERKGLRGRVTTFKTMMVFRRVVNAGTEQVDAGTGGGTGAASMASDRAARREPLLAGSRSEGGAAAPIGPARMTSEGGPETAAASPVVSLPLEGERRG
ncbi:protein of unknown function [Meinhardsimonia xiamenensis]|jgi:hypothetical protein|uniref:DUF4177 domain-containing protein n=1 Tax=Meinhardsimonia xiamenensis TaxID=990712 RepID=A0A1G9CWA7_9RHOB|nr:DUF4177 domain-containing protein [Meinhardsimonia xiamenensis]PRX38221.1 uncharacterized protein DUF4177 [Meinhardsimonia xiamenensis]SDK55978.1 protein of unknown function [Meinhardsimonia xiamenensis]